MRSAISVLLMILLASASSGCGLIFGGTRQPVGITSVPDEAKVTTTEGVVYTTPTSFQLERKDNYVLIVEKEGYQSATVQINRQIMGGIVVLDVLCGLVGVVIDAATGAWYKLVPKTASVTLTKAADVVEGPDTIEVTLRIDQDWVGIAAPTDVTVRVEKR